MVVLRVSSLRARTAPRARPIGESAHVRGAARVTVPALALNSVALNLNEGSGRNGGDRQQHFAIAFGSLREVGAVLDIAAAHGWFVEPPFAAERDRLAGMLWSLKRR